MSTERWTIGRYTAISIEFLRVLEMGEEPKSHLRVMAQRAFFPAGGGTREMHHKEMPIVVRLSQTELTQALGQSEDSSVQRTGGLTVVLRAIQVGPERGTVPLDLIGAIGGPPALRALAAAFRTVEQSLFRRLKADPALARRFVLDPGGALAELGLATTTCQAEVGISAAATEAGTAASNPLRSDPLRSNPLRS